MAYETLSWFGSLLNANEGPKGKASEVIGDMVEYWNATEGMGC